MAGDEKAVGEKGRGARLATLGSADLPAAVADTAASGDAPVGRDDAPAALAATAASGDAPVGKNDGEAALAETAAAAGDRAEGETRDAELRGRELHHFRVEQRLGQGGMGTVYRARDLSLDRPVALKVISGDLVGDTQTRERFVSEARAQAKLAHPHVASIYYIGEQRGQQFFAMELVEGGSLADGLERGERLEVTRAIELMLQVAAALDIAHQRGFIHRDIKPSNLLLDGTGAVKVADFGLARPIAKRADGAVTQEGAVVGSPLYIAPEQGKAEAVDHRADIYALGATFYHLLAGRPPFVADNAIALITKHASDPPTPLRELRPELPPALCSVIDRMLSKRPEARYADYGELIDALRAARPDRVVPAGLWVRAMALGADAVLLSILSSFVDMWIWLIYPVYLVVGWHRFGRTPGKWLFRIEVRSLDGPRPSLARCAVRAVVLNWGLLVVMGVAWAQWLVLGTREIELGVEATSLGELWARAGPQLSFVLAYALIGLLYFGSLAATGFRRERRALHDLAAATRVVYDVGGTR